MTKQGAFTVELVVRLLDTATRATANTAHPNAAFLLQNKDGDPYNTVPFHRRWSGSRPIRLEPIAHNVQDAESSSSSGSDATRDAYVTLLIHIQDDLAEEGVAAEFKQVLESISLRPGFTAKVLFKLTTSSTLLLLAVPIPILECLERIQVSFMPVTFAPEFRTSNILS